MAYQVLQTGRNIRVAYKAESTFNTIAASGGGATQFRVNSGGLIHSRGRIVSGEVRPDGMRTRDRLGFKDVKGSYVADLSVGTFDALFAASHRTTFSSPVSLSQATGALGAVTVAAHTITNAGDSWITRNLRVGDVIVPGTGFATANKINCRITGLTASVITVAETLTVEGPLATWALSSPKKILMGTTPASFSMEETDQDIGVSRVFTGVRMGGYQLAMKPDGMGLVTFDAVGADMVGETGGSSPYFTSPSKTTNLGLTAVEAAILVGGAAIVNLTAFDLKLDLKAAGEKVIGAAATPDVFTNSADVTVKLSGLYADLTLLNDYLNETQLAFQALFVDTAAEPKNFVSFFMSNLTMGSNSLSTLGQNGPRVQSIDVVVGADDQGGAYDDTMIKLQTSAS